MGVRLQAEEFDTELKMLKEAGQLVREDPLDSRNRRGK